MKTRIVPGTHTTKRTDCWCGPGFIETATDIKIVHRDPVGVVFGLHPLIAAYPKVRKE